MSARLFGTDGIRGRAGEGWLAVERVSALGRAIGEILGASGAGRAKALLGHDGRRSGPALEAALARGLAASGFECTSAGLVTTPGLATLARLDGFRLAAMISASHNPAGDNGIKVFDAAGEKLADALEDEVEARARARPEPVAEGPPPRHDPELEKRYLAHLVTAAAPLELDGTTIALDCANGGASRVAPRVLGRLGARVLGVACEPDGDNINERCGSTHPQTLQEAVRLQGASLGIALDGDGDRCVLVDETGALVHGDGIMTLLARHMAGRGELPDPRIVATVMSNRGLHRALREVGVEVLTVDVGDRRVVEALRRENLRLGGEQSGHLVFGADNGYVGDGIYTAVRVLAVVRETGVPLSELAAAYRPLPQVLVNVPVTEKPPLDEMPSVRDAVRGIEQELGIDGRVLLRYSGTEPLARIMVEGPDAERITGHAHALAELLARAIGSPASAERT